MKKPWYDPKDPKTISIEKRLDLFCKELEKLSLKYDITVYSNDGLRYYDEGALNSVDYVADLEDRTLEFHVGITPHNA